MPRRPTRAVRAYRRKEDGRPLPVKRVGARDMQPGVEAPPQGPRIVDQSKAGGGVGEIGHQDGRSDSFFLDFGRNRLGLAA